MIRKCILASVTLMFLAGTASALTLEPLRGWTTDMRMDKALALAKKRDCPIVMLYAPQEGGEAVSRARVFMRHPILKSMVRILVYESQKPPRAFRQVAGQVQAPGDGLPRLYITTPDLKILGFVPGGGHKKTLVNVAKIAKKTTRWMKKSIADMKAAEKGAAAGRFGTALKTYRRIIEEDKERAIIAHRTWRIGLSKDEVDHFYFPGMDEKIEALTPMAEARLEKAGTAFENKDYKKAKIFLVPMVRDKCDLEAVKAAAELLKKVEAALKEEK